MKVISIDPGSVLPWKGEGKWGYSIRYNGDIIRTFDDRFDSAAAAKQAMREKVAHERKRHAI